MTTRTSKTSSLVVGLALALPVGLAPTAAVAGVGNFASYLGGSGDDSARAVHALADGSSIVVGRTASSNFPTTPGALNRSCNLGNACPDAFSGGDAFVTKFAADGASVIFSTFLGGSADDGALDVTLTAGGHIVVVGQTQSSDFPTTAGAFDTSYQGFRTPDGFLTILSGDGSAILYSTFFGGGSQDQILAVDLDSSGNIYVSGLSESTDFPTTVGAFDTALASGASTFDAFAAKFTAAGALVYSTFLGGDDFESATTIAVGQDGTAIVGGSTQSSNFPITAGVLDASHAGFTEGFVTKLNASGSGLVFSTFLGGASVDDVSDLDLDTNGKILTIGSTNSTDFSITTGSLDDTKASSGDAFFAVLDSSATNLQYSTFLSIAFSARYTGSALDPGPNGTAFLLFAVSETGSFADREPSYLQIDPSKGGAAAIVFDCRLCLRFSQGVPNDIKMSAGGMVLVGESDPDGGFAVTAGAFDETHNGSFDGFVVGTPPAEIFADGFESGDASAWSRTVQ